MPDIQAERCLIALCCHHRCEFELYVNHAYLEHHGIGGRRTFETLLYISTWATCHFQDVTNSTVSMKRSATSDTPTDIDVVVQDVDNVPEEEKDDEEDMQVSAQRPWEGSGPLTLNLTNSERTRLGRQCKDILDYGRLLYARDRLYLRNAKLFRYVDASVSLENVALFLKK